MGILSERHVNYYRCAIEGSIEGMAIEEAIELAIEVAIDVVFGRIAPHFTPGK